MQWESTRGKRLDLRIAGYEFPAMAGYKESDPEWDDANWLMIAGSVRARFGDAWSFFEPCMRVSEAQRLAVWLQDVCDGAQPDPIDFLEPCLAFSAVTTVDVVTVTVRFSHEASRSRRFDDPVDVAFIVESADFARAATQWREEIARFPPR